MSNEIPFYDRNISDDDRATLEIARQMRQDAIDMADVAQRVAQHARYVASDLHRAYLYKGTWASSNGRLPNPKEVLTEALSDNMEVSRCVERLQGKLAALASAADFLTTEI